MMAMPLDIEPVGEQKAEESIPNDYFAAAPSDEIAQELQAKVDGYYNYIISSNLVELWRRAYRAYYGMRQNIGSSGWGIFDTGGLIAAGDQGEIIRAKVNQFANLVTHQLTTTTANRPALECRARNSDAKSLVSAQLGDGILDYYFREKGVEEHYFLGLETAAVMSEAYTVLGWDAKAGNQYGGKDSITYEGDLTVRDFTPFQVVKDVTKTSASRQNWYIVRDRRNKYDLMAEYPALAAKIYQVGPDSSASSNRAYADPATIIAAENFGAADSDDIPYCEFYHERTSALPQGRYTIFINGDIKLFDGPLPFRKVPVYRMAAKNIIGTPFGWTTAFDILALQELLDKLYTVVSSNVLGSGIQNFWSPPNNGVTVTELGGNRSLIESFTKPEVLQLLSTPAEVYNYINKIESVMETLMGVSAINRGEVPTKDMSGSAMAFLAAQAVTFQSAFQAGAVQYLEAVGTGMVHIITDFAPTPRLAVIAGKQNRPLMKTYSGKDLEPINNVVCDAASALSKTTSGKIAIADSLLNAGLVKDTQEYLTLIKTGNSEPLTRGVIMQNFLIQQENEWLLEGKKVIALKIDQHAQHISEHVSLLGSPAAREDGTLVENTLAHIAEHEMWIAKLQAMDPTLLAATHQPPMPVANGQPAQPAPQQQQPPAEGQLSIGETLANVSPIVEKAQDVNMPNMPNLPKGSDASTQEGYQQLQQAQGM